MSDERSTAAPPAAPVDDFIEALAGEGQLDSAGSFTLDREVAREKMARFQLAEPHTYVLELVQAAVLKGASRIELTIDADDMRMRFDGRPFTRQDFEDLYDAPLSEGQGDDWEARRQLAIALYAAQSLKLAFVVVASGTGDDSAQLVVRRGQVDVLHSRDLGIKNTQIHIKRRLLQLDVKRIGQSLTGRLSEELTLRERCRFARLPIELGGRCISRQPDPLSEPDLVYLEEGGVRVVAMHRPDETARVLYLVRHGVVVVKRTLPTSRATPGGFAAVVECAGFRLDLSQRDIVEDDTFARAVQLAERVLETATRVACLRGYFHDRKSARSRKLLSTKCWEVARPPTEDLLHVQLADSQPLILVADSGNVYERSSARWSSHRVEGFHGRLNAAWAPRWGELVVADTAENILLQGDSSWERVPTVHIIRHARLNDPNMSETPEPPFVDEPTEESAPPPVFAAFDLSKASKESKERRLPEPQKLGSQIHGVWADHGNSFWAAGARGRVFHQRNGIWERHELPTDKGLRAVWASGDDCVTVVGSNDTILTFDGERWQRAHGPGTVGEWRAVWGTGPEEIHAVGAVRGERRFPVWAITRYDGSQWSHVPLPEPLSAGLLLKGPNFLCAVWGSSPRNVFAVGTRGVILRYDGACWQQMRSGTRVRLRSVWGTAPDDVYAVGDNFTCLHYDGDRWTAVGPPLLSQRLNLRQLRDQLPVDGRVVHLPGTEAPEQRHVESVGSAPALALRGDLPDDALERLARVLNRVRIHRA